MLTIKVLPCDPVIHQQKLLYNNMQIHKRYLLMLEGSRVPALFSSVGMRIRSCGKMLTVVRHWLLLYVAARAARCTLWRRDVSATAATVRLCAGWREIPLPYTRPNCPRLHWTLPPALPDILRVHGGVWMFKFWIYFHWLEDYFLYGFTRWFKSTKYLPGS